RKEPQRGPNGEQVSGVLESVEERIDEEYVRNTWGGGIFQLKVQKPNPKGGWLHFKAFTLRLPGPPKLGGVEQIPGRPMMGLATTPVAERGDDGSSGLADRAMAIMAQNSAAD